MVIADTLVYPSHQVGLAMKQDSESVLTNSRRAAQRLYTCNHEACQERGLQVDFKRFVGLNQAGPLLLGF